MSGSNSQGGPGPASGPSDTAAGIDPLISAVWYNESRRRIAPGIYGDYVNGKPTAFGPMEVHQGALSDVNRAWGTNYNLQQLADDPQLGMKVGSAYLAQQYQRFGGNPVLALAAYNAGPGAAAAGRIPQGYVQSALGQMGGGSGYASAMSVDPRSYATASGVDPTQAGGMNSLMPQGRAVSADQWKPPDFGPGQGQTPGSALTDNPLLAVLLSQSRVPVRAIQVDYDPFKAGVSRRGQDVAVNTNESRMGTLPSLGG